MYFKQPILPSGISNIGYLAPIPVFTKVYNDSDFHKQIYDFGYNILSEKQKLMGQELPDKFDTGRQEGIDYVDKRSMWVENTERNPIGSRYYVEPNNFLDIDDKGVKIIRDRIEKSFVYFVENLGFTYTNSPTITESWIQYYDPYEGRGHNRHNHSRWQPEEEPELGFSGGYYLSDGDPVKDHPYSGVFTFHVREISYFIRPKPGMLLIWPNDIVHSVKPFYGQTHRCVINFNIQIQ